MMMTSTGQQNISLEDWGAIEYGAAWEAQERILAEQLQIKRDWNLQDENLRGPQPATSHRLVLCSHPHVYTLGKSGALEHLLLNDMRLQQLGVAFYKTNRGGDITYHGPGQVVGYPMLDLEKFFTDLGHYMRLLEEVIIRTLAAYGVQAGRLAGATGVWIEPEDARRARKICAMGVRCSRWITMHGFALNVNTDLRYFDYIVPCGISDKGVTSLQKELGYVVDESELKRRLVLDFLEVFDARKG